MNNNAELIARHVPETGFFLEIGCWDGEHISQTFALEKKGWTGICVDPFPRNFQNRKCLLLKQAIDVFPRKRKFIKVSIDRRHGGDVSYFSGFKDVIGKNETVREIIFNHCDYEEIELHTFAIITLLSKCPSKIDFLSLDTEGSELELLADIPFHLYDIGVVMVEHNQDAQTKMSLLSLMGVNGYHLVDETDIDYLFKKKA